MRVLKVLLVILLFGAGAGAFVLLAPYGPRQEQFVEVQPGTSTAQIGELLRKAGIIRSGAALEALKLWETGRHPGQSLKAGEYRFDHPDSLWDVYWRMERGDVYTITLVVPEGYNLFDIAAAVQQAGLGSAGSFLEAARRDTALIARWSPGAKSLEGYLYPATYKFGRHATPATMLTAMVARFDREARELRLQGDVARVVTMASLAEKEVHVDSERPEVVGVFENRLAANMPLQTDPTVAYGSLLRGTWTGVIHQSELRSDSAYNTYTHTGLPPGPICSPGDAALRAALHPAKTEALYFVADANGSTKFARTLEEHERNVAAYRQLSSGGGRQR